jgi:hypothetical protein
MLRRDFPMLRTVVRETFNERCWDQCCEFVCGIASSRRATFSVQKITRGTRALFLPRPWLSQGVRGEQGAQTFDPPTVRSGYGAYPPGDRVPPHRMEPPPPALEPLLDTLLEGKLQIRLWCPSLPAQVRQAASMGALRQLRPTTRGQCFRRRQLGRLDPPHPAYTPFNVVARMFWDVGGRGYPCTAWCWIFGDFC